MTKSKTMLVAAAFGAVTMFAGSARADVTLTKDETWTDGRTLSGTIDLAGHKLTVSSLTGDATITSTADAGYDILEYVDSDGTAYVDTGVSVADDTVIDIKVQLLQQPAEYAAYVGARDGGDRTGQFGGWFYRLQHHSAVTKEESKFGTVTLNTDYTVHLDKNGPCTINGEAPFATGNGVGNPYTITIFAMHQSSVICQGAFRVYYCRIAYGNDVQRDLKPARRRSDGAVGFLDVNAPSKFYANAISSGVLSAGPVVSEEYAKPPAELHVNVADGQAENSTVAITGPVRVVKEGAGTLTLKKTGQSYTCGTVVAGGTLASLVDFSTLPCGIVRSAIAVGKDAVLDRKGASGLDSYCLVLDGGMLTCTYNPDDKDHTCTLRDLELTADSRLVFDAALTVGADITVRGDAVWELNGHVLDIVFAGNDPDMWVQNGMTLRHGTVRTTMPAGKGWLHDQGINGKDGGCFDLATNLRLDCSGGSFGTFSTVSNLTIRTPNNNVGSSGYQMVYGAYAPLSSYAYKVEMQDGSTLNLGELAGPWSTTPLNNAACTATFAAGSTIFVDLGERKVTSAEPVVTWGAKPANVKFQPVPGAAGSFTAKDNGLYWRIGFSVIVR